MVGVRLTLHPKPNRGPTPTLSGATAITKDLGKAESLAVLNMASVILVGFNWPTGCGESVLQECDDGRPVQSVTRCQALLYRALSTSRHIPLPCHD